MAGGLGSSLDNINEVIVKERKSYFFKIILIYIFLNKGIIRFTKIKSVVA